MEPGPTLQAQLLAIPTHVIFPNPGTSLFISISRMHTLYWRHILSSKCLSLRAQIIFLKLLLLADDVSVRAMWLPVLAVPAATLH